MPQSLRAIAHSRTDDKGDTSNISVIAYDPKDYARLERHVTAERVKAHFADLVRGEVTRYGLPGDEVWLIGEWRDSGERKHYLSNLPPRTSLRRLAATVKARWSCEQVHQQLKQELGLGDFEGRSWTGLHRHALMTCIAFAYLQHRRLKAAGRGKKAGPQRAAATALAA